MTALGAASLAALFGQREAARRPTICPHTRPETFPHNRPARDHAGDHTALAYDDVGGPDVAFDLQRDAADNPQPSPDDLEVVATLPSG